MIACLPDELIKYIYDYCCIEEKIKLNIALPKSLKIKSNKNNDIKLGMLSFLMKHKESIKPLSKEIYNFLETNKSDPTVIQFCKHFDVVLKDIPIKPFELLKKDIVSGDLSRFDKYPALTELNYIELFDLHTTIYRNINAQSFKILYNNPKTREIISYTHLFIENFLIYGNEEMIKFLIEEGVQYNMPLNINENFYKSTAIYVKKTRDLYFKYFDIPKNIKHEILYNGIENLSTDIFLDLRFLEKNAQKPLMG